MNHVRDETHHQNMATHSILIFFCTVEARRVIFFFSIYLAMCVCALIIWNGSSNFHDAARNLSRSPLEFRSDDHSLPYMVISCLFPRLPASHHLCCQLVGASPTDLPAAVIAPADLLVDPPPTRPPPPPPSCAQTAGRERERGVWVLTQDVCASMLHLPSRHKPSGEDISSNIY